MKRILLIIASFALTAGIVAAQEKVFIKDYFLICIQDIAH